MKKRRNTQLESEGAEFLVVGWLLINGIEAHKMYTKAPGYDLIAVNIKNKKSISIQVKSRYQTGVGHFIIKNFDSDYVAIVLLNRGYAKPRKNGEKGIKEPQIYLVPTKIIKAAQDPDDNWRKVSLSKIPNLKSYQDNLDLLKKQLGIQNA